MGEGDPPPEAKPEGQGLEEKPRRRPAALEATSDTSPTGSTAVGPNPPPAAATAAAAAAAAAATASKPAAPTAGAVQRDTDSLTYTTSNQEFFGGKAGALSRVLAAGRPPCPLTCFLRDTFAPHCCTLPLPISQRFFHSRHVYARRQQDLPTTGRST